MQMIDFEEVRGGCGSGNHTVLLNSERQHTITLVVDVLSDEIDATWVRMGCYLALSQ